MIIQTNLSNSPIEKEALECYQIGVTAGKKIIYFEKSGND
jgi:hypothetical protein